jgi:hypothetical protein
MSKEKKIYYLTVTLLLLINKENLLAQSKGNFQKYSVDKNISAKVESAKKESEFGNILEDNAFWFLFNNEIFTLLDQKDNAQHFLDTAQMLSQVPCDCMIKKDTVYLQGGIGYEGSVGFSLKIINDLYEGNIWLGGKEYQTTNSPTFSNETFLQSIFQSLIIQSKDSLKLGDKLKGQLIMESENYFIKGDKTPNKIFMKLLFDCKLDDTIVF